MRFSISSSFFFTFILIAILSFSININENGPELVNAQMSSSSSGSGSDKDKFEKKKPFTIFEPPKDLGQNKDGIEKFEELRVKVWTNFVGMTGEDAKEQMLREYPSLKVQIIPENAMVTMDYRIDRMRIFVDKDNKVVRAPRLG